MEVFFEALNKLWETSGIALFLMDPNAFRIVARPLNGEAGLFLPMAARYVIIALGVLLVSLGVKKQTKPMVVGGLIALLLCVPGIDGRLIMICIGLVIIYLAIGKGFEPLLLVPIGFGAVLTNIPFEAAATAIADLTVDYVNQPGTPIYDASHGQWEVIHKFGGFIGMIYGMGVKSGLFPLLIFMGVGAMTDFGPLIANPKTLLLGAAAQFGIFLALIGALILNSVPGLSYNLYEAASIGIIGGADGPTSIYLTAQLAPQILGAVAVAAYSYMALVPIIQPPIMRLFTTKEERMIKMEQLRHVSKAEKIVFPLVALGLCVLLLQEATPLLGALMFGNLCKECGVVERLSDTMQNALMNTVTIMLGLSVGSKMAASEFLQPNTLGIMLLGLVAFSIGTMSGVLLAKLMNAFSKKPINPLIGAAGVSAVPMAARVASKVGQEENPQNYLLMHAMGPNVAGVIGSAVAAGTLLKLVPYLASQL